MDNSIIVALKNIVVDFDGEPILTGLSLDIHDKEFVTLLGPSGCGKTTTLRVIGGFVEPRSGNVFLRAGTSRACRRTNGRSTPCSRNTRCSRT